MTVYSRYVNNDVRCQPTTRRPRIGVMLDSLIVPKWESQVLGMLERPIVELVFVAKVVRGPGDRSLQRGSFLFELWRHLDKSFFQTRCMSPDTFDPVPLWITNSQTEIRELRSTWVGDQLVLDADGLDVVRRLDLDVLINLSEIASDDALRTCVRFGVWSFDDDAELLAEIAAKMEAKDYTTGNGIRISHRGKEHGRMNCSTVGLDRLSLYRNYSNLCSKRPIILFRILKSLQRNVARTDAFTSDAARHRSLPGTIETAHLLGSVLLRATGQLIRKQFFHEHWFIAYKKRSGAGGWSGTGNFSILEAPSEHFYADPFVVDRDARTYLFFEDFSYQTNKGIISFVELDGGNGCSHPEVALEEPYHLSYPCIFEWCGEIYMIPETRENRSIQLYRAHNFPRRWELVDVLFHDVAAVDPTILYHNGNFWLFTSGIGSSTQWFDGRSELFLFFADSLLGPWTAHPANPIVSDIRRCRPAGRIFVDNGKLIRPGQDYSTIDSGAVTFNSIDLLTKTEYHEAPIAKILPGWIKGNLGTHTFNRSDRYEVVDGRTLMGIWAAHREQPSVHTVRLREPLVEMVPSQVQQYERHAAHRNG